MGRPFWIAVLAAAILMLGGYVLLGLPGALIGMLADPLVVALRGLPEPMFSGEAAWPLAILLSIAVPPVLPVAVLVQRRWFPALKGWQVALVLLAALYVWTVVLLLLQTL